ncbi:hypothetical protein [Ramlibacter sp. AN1133]
MAAVLNNAIIVVAMRLLTQLPSLDDLLRSMNSEEALRDGSRYL